jgi:hypothetical protein
MNATKWLDMNSRVTSRLLLDLIFDKESRNHNEFELLFPPPHSLAHLGGLITPTWPLMVEIMHDDNTNVLNAVILHISNGIAPFTSVEHVEKRHQDTHHELVMDASMMMVSAAIMISMDTKMEILTENANLHCLFVSIYFPNCSKVERHFLYLSSFSPFHQMNYYYVSFSYFFFEPRCWSFNQQTLSTCHPSQTLDLVSQKRGPLICHDHVLYGVHQSLFNQSPLFQEIIHYGESNEIGTNPYHPIPFDTPTKEIFDNFLYLLYFGAEHLEHLTPAEWLNVKRLCMDWYFP